MVEEKVVCVYCKRSQEEVPLIELHYRDDSFWICPQHLPVLIHQPEVLADLIDGVEGWGKVTHDDHEQ
jgi:hypothetical protein